MSNKQLMRLKVACKQLQLLKNRERIYKSTLVKAACKRLLIKKAEDTSKPATAPTTPSTATPASTTPADTTTSEDFLPLDPSYTYDILEQMAKGTGPQAEDAKAQLAAIDKKVDWSNYNNTLGRIARWFIEDDEHRKAAVKTLTNPKFRMNDQLMEEWLQNEYGELNPEMRKKLIASAHKLYNNSRVFSNNLAAFNKNRSITNMRSELDDLTQRAEALRNQLSEYGIDTKPNTRSGSGRGRRRPYDYSQYDIMADAFGYAGFPYHSRNWLTDNLMQYDDVFAKRVYDQLGKDYRRPGSTTNIYNIYGGRYDQDNPVNPVNPGDIIDVPSTPTSTSGIPASPDLVPYDPNAVDNWLATTRAGGDTEDSYEDLSAEPTPSADTSAVSIGGAGGNPAVTFDLSSLNGYTAPAIPSVYSRYHSSGAATPTSAPGATPLASTTIFGSKDRGSNEQTMKEVVATIKARCPWLSETAAEQFGAYLISIGKSVDEFEKMSDDERALLRSGKQIWNKYMNPSSYILGAALKDVPDL